MKAGRLGVALLVLGSVGGLGYGPAQHYLVDADEAAVSVLSVSLVDDPAAAPQLPVWPVGVVDTADAVPGDGLRPEPPVTPLTYAEAEALAGEPLTVTLVGKPRGEGLLGVGAVVTAEDVAYLADLPEPARTRVVGFIAEADGAALSVTGVDGYPAGELDVVRRGSSDESFAALAAHPEVDALVRIWSQVRPELTAVVGSESASPGVAGQSGLMSGVSGPAGVGPDYADAVEDAVVDEILPALDAGRVPLSVGLLADRSPAGLVDVEDDEPRLTARGAAYAVAARVVQPGARPVGTRTTGTVVTRAFARPGGGVSVLLWNPGGRRTVAVQVPSGDRVLRFSVELAAGALTGAVLGAR